MLWGLIACHHDTPRLMTFDVRATCRALAGALARQIRAKEEADSYRQRIRLRGIEDEIVRMLSKEDAVEKISAHRLRVSSDVACRRRGRPAVGRAGLRRRLPVRAAIETLATWIVAASARTVSFATNHLAELYPPAERAFEAAAAGCWR